MTVATERPARRAAGRTGGGTLSWRVLRHGADTGARNMALDHALALSARPDVGVLRLYRWSTRTVSFGRNEPALARYGGMAASGLHVDAVRRPTGGRAVLHDDELTYAVVVPVVALGGPRATYARINEALASALRRIGAEVALAPAGPIAALDSGACFRAPAPGEVVSEGRKIVGSAQARIGSALLQHGSILLGGDQSALSSGRTASLSELVGPVDLGLLEREVEQALASSVGGSWLESSVTEEEGARAARLEVERYGTQEWTWRR